jgi:hypothetical protein
MPQQAKRAAAMVRGEPRDVHAAKLHPSDNKSPPTSQLIGSQRKHQRANSAPLLVASIDKTASTQLRISLSTWRGQHKVELSDLSAVIAGTYFQTGNGIAIPIEKLAELIAALRKAEAQAVSLGLITERGIRPVEEGGAR